MLDREIAVDAALDVAPLGGDADRLGDLDRAVGAHIDDDIEGSDFLRRLCRGGQRGGERQDGGEDPHPSKSIFGASRLTPSSSSK